MLSRRTLILGGLAACVLAQPLVALAREHYLKENEDLGLATLAEFSDAVLPGFSGRSEITILYPGSNSDLKPLEIGFQLLYRSPIQQVNFIYTEIGEYEKDLPTWHGGSQDLQKQIENGLEELVSQGLIKKPQKEILSNHPWVRPSLLNSAVIQYVITVPTNSGTKTINLRVGYNTFENREEPTEEEKKVISPKLLQDCRFAYWPTLTKPGAVYPTYFNQKQFDAADVIISKMCGDFHLLQFDYVRAALRTKAKRLRVVLTEHSNDLGPVRDSLATYQTSVQQLKANHYGYCDGSKDNGNACEVGILTLNPK